MKLTRLPDGEGGESRYQSEDGRFTIEGPWHKRNSGYGNDWTLNDSKRFMVDLHPRIGFPAIIPFSRSLASLAICRKHADAILEGEASGAADLDQWYGYGGREAAQAAINAHRARERESRRLWDAVKRREERCKRAVEANPAIRDAAAAKAEALNPAIEQARQALWRVEEAQRRLMRTAR